MEPGKNNYPALFAVLAAVALVAGAAAFVTSSDDDDGGAEGAQGGGDGDLQVVEEGFSNYLDAADETTSAYGIVIENNGGDTFVDAFVEVAVHDPTGTVIWESEFRTGILRPGERLGLGDELWTSDVVQPIGSLVVTFPDAGDHKADDVPEGAYETADATEAGAVGNRTAFTVASSYGTDAGETAVISAVYRNTAGKIVGGAAAQATVPVGSSGTSVELFTYTVIPDIAKTDVFASPTNLLT